MRESTVIKIFAAGHTDSVPEQATFMKGCVENERALEKHDLPDGGGAVSVRECVGVGVCSGADSRGARCGH